GALPPTTQGVAVLDRTKEPGAVGEPLYQDVVTAMTEFADLDANYFRSCPRVFGGRYGLSSKEFTPGMVKSVFDSLDQTRPKNHFTVGIVDDVTHTSLSYDATFNTESDEVVRAVFFGLGSDGTVGANKNTVKIIGEETDLFAQGYFVYDSKKAGSQTVSHLRFGPRPIRSTYLVQRANFIACHQEAFLDRVDMLEQADEGATFLLNTWATPDRVWATLPREVREPIVQKRLKFYVIDAGKVARQVGMGNRINTIMQTCFFALSGVLPREEAIEKIKASIRKTYESKGTSVVEKNFAAVDQTIANLFEVQVPSTVGNGRVRPPVLSEEAPAFVRDVTGAMIAGRGDGLPVSAMPVDGTFPTDTARWEKRNLAWEIPIWDPEVCIQCNKCALVCPHAAIRAKVFEKPLANSAPSGFQWIAARGAEYHGLAYSLQVAPEDCTGCGLCVEICPAKNKREVRLKAINMRPHAGHVAAERENYRFFLDIPEFDRSRLKLNTVKGSQFLLPLFEYSGACAGCGETPYIKLVTQLFGDRAIIANATGCSSIYGGNLPTTPYAKNKEGRGPTWCNSLFEDNAEFGLGFRLSLDKQREFASELLCRLASSVDVELAKDILTADQSTEAGIEEQRKRVAMLRERLAKLDGPEAFNLLMVADTLIKRSVWIWGGA
ncbi:MAG: 2-oxoacid:acceptor oxidoreductase family protein, partial [Planctomycetota bacterium]